MKLCRFSFLLTVFVTVLVGLLIAVPVAMMSIGTYNQKGINQASKITTHIGENARAFNTNNSYQ